MKDTDPECSDFAPETDTGEQGDYFVVQGECLIPLTYDCNTLATEGIPAPSLGAGTFTFSQCSAALTSALDSIVDDELSN